MTVNDWLAIVVTICGAPLVAAAAAEAWHPLSRPGKAARPAEPYVYPGVRMYQIPTQPPHPAPPPNYREPAARTLADEVAALRYRVDALELAEVERALHKMAADSASVVPAARRWCTRVHMDPADCTATCPGRHEMSARDILEAHQEAKR